MRESGSLSRGQRHATVLVPSVHRATDHIVNADSCRVAFQNDVLDAEERSTRGQKTSWLSLPVHRGQPKCPVSWPVGYLAHHRHSRINISPHFAT